MQCLNEKENVFVDQLRSLAPIDQFHRKPQWEAQQPTSELPGYTLQVAFVLQGQSGPCYRDVYISSPVEAELWRNLILDFSKYWRLEFIQSLCNTTTQKRVKYLVEEWSRGLLLLNASGYCHTLL